MKQTHPQSIGDILRQTLEENRLDTRLLEYSAINAFPLIVGPEIAAKCGKPYVVKGIMTISVPNAALRHELSMSRSSLIRHLNAAIKNDNIIKDIRFIR